MHLIFNVVGGQIYFPFRNTFPCFMWQLNGENDYLRAANKPCGWGVCTFVLHLNILGSAARFRSPHIWACPFSVGHIWTFGSSGDNPVAPGELDPCHRPEGFPSLAVGSSSCFNDVVLERAMKTLRHVRGLLCVIEKLFNLVQESPNGIFLKIAIAVLMSLFIKSSTFSFGN